jgi:hypothetical protein
MNPSDSMPVTAAPRTPHSKTPAVLEIYGAVIRRAALVWSDAEKRKLRDRACKKGLLRWTAQQKRKVGAVGFLTGLPGGVWAAPLEVADLAYLLRTLGRGCYGVGHILNRAVDHERDIPMILAVWSGAAHVATAATAGQVAMHFANPLIIQQATPAAVSAAGSATISLSAWLASETGVRFVEKILPKALTKVAAKLAAKSVAKIVPVCGGLVACGINRWICDGMMRAAEQYYSAPVIVVDRGGGPL